MDFNAQQMREDALIKDGRYKFTVLDAREGRSMAGNDKINLKLGLEVNSRRVIYYDMLLMMPKMFWKVEHFCKVTGMPEKIDEGRLMAQDCLGKEGYIEVAQKPNAQTGELENQTKDYVEESLNQESFDEDVPDFK